MDLSPNCSTNCAIPTTEPTDRVLLVSQFTTAGIINHVICAALLHAAVGLQAFNFALLIHGLRTRVLSDPMYILWIGYGLADLSTVSLDYVFYVMMWGVHVPVSYDKKWAAFFENSLGWFPSILYQLALSLYCLIAVRFPHHYRRLLVLPAIRVKIGCFAGTLSVFSVFISIPYTLPGYDVCFCPEGGQLSQSFDKLVPYYQWFIGINLSSTFFVYVIVCAKFNRVALDSRTRRIIRRLTLTAMISWTITLLHLFLWNLSIFHPESKVARAAIQRTMYGSYQMNYLATPIVQLIRNSAYRNFAKEIIGLDRWEITQPLNDACEAQLATSRRRQGLEPTTTAAAVRHCDHNTNREGRRVTLLPPSIAQIEPSRNEDTILRIINEQPTSVTTVVEVNVTVEHRIRYGDDSSVIGESPQYPRAFWRA